VIRQSLRLSTSKMYPEAVKDQDVDGKGKIERRRMPSEKSFFGAALLLARGWSLPGGNCGGNKIGPLVYPTSRSSGHAEFAKKVLGGGSHGEYSKGTTGSSGAVATSMGGFGVGGEMDREKRNAAEGDIRGVWIFGTRGEDSVSGQGF